MKIKHRQAHKDMHKTPMPSSFLRASPLRLSTQSKIKMCQLTSLLNPGDEALNQANLLILIWKLKQFRVVDRLWCHTVRVGKRRGKYINRSPHFSFMPFSSLSTSPALSLFLHSLFLSLSIFLSSLFNLSILYQLLIPTSGK